MGDAKIARLKEPLGIIVGWVELLRRGRLDGERARFALDAIARNAHLQAKLLEELIRSDGHGHVDGSAPLSVKKASPAPPARKRAAR